MVCGLGGGGREVGMGAKQEGDVPASTRPETLSTMVFGSLVSRSLTVTVTPFQARVWTVVLRRGVSVRVPCSRSTVGASLVAGPGYEAADDTLVVAIVRGLGR